MGSQVDGGFDSLSSVSYSPEPRRFSLDEVLPVAGTKDAKTSNIECNSKGKYFVPMNVIQKRITQVNKTKCKPALLKHVFSTYTKRRRIVIVRYKKPECKIFDLEEYNTRLNEGSLDEFFDEDEDYFCAKETPVKAKKAKLEESQPKLPQPKIPCL